MPTTNELWDLVKEKFNGNVFLLKKPYTYTNLTGVEDSEIVKQWTTGLGENHCIFFDRPKAVIDMMLGIISIVTGQRSLNGYIDDMEARKQSKERIELVRKSLTSLAQKCRKGYVTNLYTGKQTEIEDDGF